MIQNDGSMGFWSWFGTWRFAVLFWTQGSGFTARVLPRVAMSGRAKGDVSQPLPASCMMRVQSQVSNFPAEARRRIWMCGSATLTATLELLITQALAMYMDSWSHSFECYKDPRGVCHMHYANRVQSAVPLLLDVSAS